MATDVAQVPPPPAGAARRRRPARVLPVRAARPVHRPLHPLGTQPGAGLRPPAARPPVPRGSPRRSLHLPLRALHRPPDHATHLYTQQGISSSATVFRTGRAVPVLGPAGDRSAPVRRPRRRDHRARRRLLRPRPVHAQPVRRAGVAVGGSGRRHAQLPARHHPRRHLRLLRRCRGRGNSTHHRVPDLAAHHSGVDGAGGGSASAMVVDQDLLRHHHHSFHRRLDRPGARGARQAAGAAPRRTS